MYMYVNIYTYIYMYGTLVYIRGLFIGIYRALIYFDTFEEEKNEKECMSINLKIPITIYDRICDIPEA